jgi:hemerythrin-like domain-containing protein
MTPAEILEHEHKITLMVLDAAKREVQSIRQKDKLHVVELEKMMDFIRNFADRCLRHLTRLKQKKSEKECTKNTTNSLMIYHSCHLIDLS